MRRLLFVIGSLELGGAEQHLVQVARGLKLRGWSPEFFLLATGGPLSSRLIEAGIPIRGVPVCPWLDRIRNPRFRARCRLLATALLLCWTMLRHRSTVVHFILPSAYVIGGLAALVTMTKPRVMSRRSRNNYQNKHPKLTRIEKFLHPYMDRICGNSLVVLQDLKEEGAGAEQLRLIYNGVDLGRFVPGGGGAVVRQELKIGHDALVFACVANLIPYKGHRDLIDALAEIRDLLPQPWRCLCIGRDDGIGPALQAYAECRGVGDRISWLGSRADVAELLVAADIGVLCSHEEGFSNAVLEGMAAALPMVVTDVGGNAEAISDGVHGLVVPAHQPSLLAHALLELARNPDRRTMGLEGRRRVERNFSLAACVDQYERLYHELLQ